MSWSPQQQALLAAMGYTLYREAGAVPAAGPVAAAVAATPAAADRLMAALQRAAGGRDLSGLALPPMEALRSGAAAKRALWPMLRAMRRR